MENIKPKYSVVIPLYNKESYVRKALESVIAQTLTDFELIVVDDGSTDNSDAICEDFFNSFTPSFFHSLIRQANSGVAAARNRGVKESKGEYVAFLDADDWWEPEFLQEIDKLIAKYPDAGIYATNYVYYKPGKTRVALNLPRGYMNYPVAYLHRDMMPVTSITTCMPRKVFDEMGGFPVGIKLGEDFLLWAKTAIHYKVVFSEKPLAYYNNDVPASLRATRNLHAPEHHMLFNMQEIEQMINDQWLMANDQSAAWHALLDKLRVGGLLAYWLSDEYHDAAAAELKKVDWAKQPKSVRRQYKMPRWVLKTKRYFMRVGSWCKQQLRKIVNMRKDISNGKFRIE